ncbi:MAG: prolipoprotein diacylglyceryl transferase [Candidatus Omnitrophica bacterium]|nr:prolipoprotein diacylglyceryl transferase [Candidatus Omnitrophota bacterium]
MHPEICKIGPLTIYSYGLMLVAAFGVATWLACAEAKKRGIDPDIIFNLNFTILICGIIGARIFYILNNLAYYLRNPLEMIMLQKGGLVWFGGLIFGLASGILYLKLRKLPVFKIADLLIPFVALAQAIGRIGCFLNGCCFGKESASGIYSPSQGALLIPTQLYSALLLIFIFIILKALQKRPHKDGQIFFAYLLLYSAKRFFIEFWRGDSPTILLGLTLFQFISLAIFLAGVIGLFCVKIKKG